MNKKAWTLAELTIAITILIILTAASMSVTRNINLSKTKMNLYAAIRNLTMANIAIREKPLSYSLFYPETAEEQDANNSIADDWYCMNVADAFSLKTAPNCAKNLDSSGVNITMQNGTTYMGLATPWKEAYDDLFYKNITIDIDGASGVNKLGVDIFPIRVFRGRTYQNINMDGIVMPVGCGNDIIYKSMTEAVFLMGDASIDHPGCTEPMYFLADNNFFSQNIYRVMEVPNKNNPRAKMIVGSVSVIEADCSAHGGKGYFNENQCTSAGYRLHKNCANERTCDGCKNFAALCPWKGDEHTTPGDLAYCQQLAQENKINDNTYECFYLMNKPSNGLGILGTGIIGDLDL